MHKTRLRFLFAIGLASCSSPGSNRTTSVYNGALTYPRTVVGLADGRQLVHEARALDGEGRHYVSAPEPGDRSSSWTLESDHDVALISVPSDLTDPAEAGEFEEYLRKHDRSCIHQSPTGNVVVIEEDRSPTGPSKNYYVLRRTSDGTWAYQKLRLEPYTPKYVPQPDSPQWNHLDMVFPDIVSVSDRGLSYTSAEGTRWIAF